MSLAKDTAETVAKHLVMAGRLVDEDPTAALTHARAARALAGRVGAVREANGLVAYMAGEWAEALSELRTARRLTGEPDHLAVMADCERALGRPDRALLVVDDPQAAGLSPATRVELLIVASGARRDLGQAEAAVISLQVAALEGPVRPWTARLRYAYADALLDAGREDEARQWFARAAEVDADGETDAEERLLALDGVVLEDLLDETEEDAPAAAVAPEDLAALAADVAARPSSVQPAGAPPQEGGSAEAVASMPEVADAPSVTSVTSGAGDRPNGATERTSDAGDELNDPFRGGGVPAEERRVPPSDPVSAPGFREPPAVVQDPGAEQDDLTLFD